MGILRQSDYANVQRIGIPRALLYYRYGTLWETFFAEMGCEVVLSGATDRSIVASGEAVSVDECCLASKVYLGHVASLLGSCDAIFAPSIGNVGLREGFCTKFQALPDLVRNTFRSQDVRVVSCLVDVQEEHLSMRDAFVDLAGRFGLGRREARRTWKTALHAQHAADSMAANTQERLLEAQSRIIAGSKKPLTILLVAHPYMAHDPYLGGIIGELLEGMGALVLHADETNRERSLKMSFDFSETLPWIISRELIGSLMLLHPHLDGIVLVSAFPCGPDSMTDDAIMRCIQGKPILNLTIDSQSGTAGLETRIESFVDILRYQQRGGYVHGR